MALCFSQGTVCVSMGNRVNMCLDTHLSQSCVTLVTYPGFYTLSMTSISIDVGISFIIIIAIIRIKNSHQVHV